MSAQDFWVVLAFVVAGILVAMGVWFWWGKK